MSAQKGKDLLLKVKARPVTGLYYGGGNAFAPGNN